jgi:hypothetical protein
MPATEQAYKKSATVDNGRPNRSDQVCINAVPTIVERLTF